MEEIFVALEQIISKVTQGGIEIHKKTKKQILVLWINVIVFKL
jgi:hypothetical protein